HASIADSGLLLVVPVVVDGDNAASDVGFASDNRIAKVAEVACLGAASDARLFGLNEIADPVVSFEVGALPQIRERTNLGILADSAFLRPAPDLQMAARPYLDILEPRGAVDLHPLADPAAPENLHAGPDHDVRGDLGLLGNVGGRRVDQRHTRGHQPAIGLFAN